MKKVTYSKKSNQILKDKTNTLANQSTKSNQSITKSNQKTNTKKVKKQINTIKSKSNSNKKIIVYNDTIHEPILNSTASTVSLTSQDIDLYDEYFGNSSDLEHSRKQNDIQTTNKEIMKMSPVNADEVNVDDLNEIILDSDDEDPLTQSYGTFAHI
ncbi:hypothetical protein BC833DRAFT_611375 [Globomyces pollinis-pini]|nr:hypothetical protein BC833DRAFT_611375 [Globomyces pollinis-pini]